MSEVGYWFQTICRTKIKIRRYKIQNQQHWKLTKKHDYTKTALPSHSWKANFCLYMVLDYIETFLPKFFAKTNFVEQNQQRTNVAQFKATALIGYGLESFTTSYNQATNKFQENNESESGKVHRYLNLYNSSLTNKSLYLKLYNDLSFTP